MAVNNKPEKQEPKQQEPGQSIAEQIAAQLAPLKEEIKSFKTENVRLRAKILSQEQQRGQTQSLDFPAIGPLGDSFFDVETVDVVRFKDKAEAALFMNEPVRVLIKKHGTPGEELFVYTGWQGITQYIPRGVPLVVKRKFIESLARGVPIKTDTIEFTDSNGERAMRIVKTPVPAYHFETEDSQNGKRWLQGIFAEA